MIISNLFTSNKHVFINVLKDFKGWLNMFLNIVTLKL